MKSRLLFLFFVMSLAGLLNAQTFVPPGEGTLSAAISEAQDGDVLELVAGGEYTESAFSKLGTVVDKSLTIRVDGDEKAIVRMLKSDLTADSAGVFFRMGDQSSLILNGLELDGNSKIKYLVSFYMPVENTPTLIKKIQIEDCYVHDITGDAIHGEKSSGIQGYVVFDSTIINNSVFHRTGPVVHYKQAGSDFISLTNSTIADVSSYGLRACGCDASEGSALPDHTPEVVIDHTTWYNIGTTDKREIILGEKGPLYRPWTITNSIFVKQCSSGGKKVFINIKDNNTTSSESCMGTITNICFWKIDKIAFYMHTVRDTIRMDPQFADTNNYDFTLPVGSPLLTFGTDGKPIGDPRWGTNYVGLKPVVENIPEKFGLASIYPNPFNPTTTISFRLPENGFATLAIYDLRGNLISQIVNEYLIAGEYRFAFDGSHLQSGIYLCRLTAGQLTNTRKMVLLK